MVLEEMPPRQRQRLIRFFIRRRIRAEADAILLTQHFANLGVMSREEQQRLYTGLRDGSLQGLRLIIKPHPDDTLDYRGIFPDAYVIREIFPAELCPIFFAESRGPSAPWIPPAAKTCADISVLFSWEGTIMPILPVSTPYNKLSLVAVNSVYQLLTAVHMRRTILCDGETDLLLTDTTPKLMDYLPRLKETGLFRRVISAKTKELSRKYAVGSMEEISEGYRSIPSIFRWVLSDELDDYGAIYFANFDTFMRMLACQYYDQPCASSPTRTAFPPM